MHKLNISSNRLLQGFSILAISALTVVQLFHLNPYISSFDAVDFALALSRFDLMAMQPHFPGYPYFILGGKMGKLFFDNPAQALSIFNILFYLSALFPIYRLFVNLKLGNNSWLASAGVYTASFIAVSVNQPMSEGAALAALWWFFWSLQKSFVSPNKKNILISLFLLSILLGIRVSYIPFASGIAFLFYTKWKESSLSLKQLIQYSLIAICFQLIWVTGLVFTEGSVKGFLNLALGFTSGHFEDWGGTAAAAGAPIWDRLFLLILNNIVWTGMAARSTILAVFFLVAAIVAIWFNRKQLFIRSNLFIQAMILMFGFYFGWALLAQNIEKARHSLPLAVLLVFLLVSLLLVKESSRGGQAVVLTLIALQIWTASDLIIEQSTNKPAVYQLTEYSSQLEKHLILYTWEESRVLDYLEADFPHKEILTYEFFLYDSGLYRNHDILLTGNVVQGFREQGADIRGKIEKVEVFSSNPLFEPVYNEIVLYRWKVNK